MPVKRVVVVAALAVLFPIASHAQWRACAAADASCLRIEAINVLQGADTSTFLDTGRIQLVMHALAAIRNKLPQLADVGAGPDRSYLVLDAADSSADVFVKRSRAQRPRGADTLHWRTPVARTGIRALDSLNRVFGVSRIIARYFLGSTQLELHFRRPVSISVVAAAYERVPQVEFAMPEGYDGDGSWVRVLPKGRQLLVVFARGGGDCPAGCTEWDYYYTAYDTLDHSVVLAHQVLKGTRWSQPIFYWDTPTRYSINPYPTIDSLYAGLREHRWWYRMHAVQALALLMGKDTTSSYGEQSPGKFKALKKSALARRHESYEALIQRLADRDADVARAAHTSLLELTGMRLPGGSAGIGCWQQWLRATPQLPSVGEPDER